MYLVRQNLFIILCNTAESMTRNGSNCKTYSSCKDDNNPSKEKNEKSFEYFTPISIGITKRYDLFYSNTPKEIKDDMFSMETYLEEYTKEYVKIKEKLTDDHEICSYNFNAVNENLKREFSSHLSKCYRCQVIEIQKNITILNGKILNLRNLSNFLTAADENLEKYTQEIQKLKKRNEELKKQNKELKKQNKELKKTNDELLLQRIN